MSRPVRSGRRAGKLRAWPAVELPLHEQARGQNDTRRVMKCCLAHILPSGHVVPFCAYNTLYRDGHFTLPPLAEAGRRSLEVVSR